MKHDAAHETRDDHPVGWWIDSQSYLVLTDKLEAKKNDQKDLYEEHEDSLSQVVSPLQAVSGDQLLNAHLPFVRLFHLRLSEFVKAVQLVKVVILELLESLFEHLFHLQSG